MDFDTFQTAIAANVPALNATDARARASLALAASAGQAVDDVKKHLYHGAALDPMRVHGLRLRLGHTLAAVAELAAAVGLALDECADALLDERDPTGRVRRYAVAAAHKRRALAARQEA